MKLQRKIKLNECSFSPDLKAKFIREEVVKLVSVDKSTAVNVNHVELRLEGFFHRIVTG